MSNQERIAIREAGRRLGVSDTAVRKAIKDGRVTSVTTNPNNGRPELLWPAARDEFAGNSDTTRRSHVGSQGSRRRVHDNPEVSLPTNDRLDELPELADGTSAASGTAGPKSGRGGQYNQARAAREVYQAKMAKLEYEKAAGLLVPMDTVRAEAFKAHRMVRDAILNIPDRCAPHLATLAEPAEVHAYLLTEINEALRKLAADLYAPAQQP